MRKTLILLLAALALFSPTAIFAHKDKHAGSSKFEVKIESEDDGDDDANFEVGQSSFEIRGEIGSILGNSFTISDQTIVVDPSQVSEFKQKGILVVGNMANPLAGPSTHNDRISSGILVGREPHEPTFTRNGKELWVSAEIGGTVSVIDMDTKQITEKIEFEIPGVAKDAIQPVGVRIAKDGKKALVALGP